MLLKVKNTVIESQRPRKYVKINDHPMGSHIDGLYLAVNQRPSKSHDNKTTFDRFPISMGCEIIKRSEVQLLQLWLFQSFISVCSDERLLQIFLRWVRESCRTEFSNRALITLVEQFTKPPKNPELSPSAFTQSVKQANLTISLMFP